MEGGGVGQGGWGQEECALIVRLMDDRCNRCCVRLLNYSKCNFRWLITLEISGRVACRVTLGFSWL